MDDETSIAVVSSLAGMGMRRGDYIDYTGLRRVLRVNGPTITTRFVMRYRIVEWARARVEDWVQWPLADFQSRFRVRP